MLVLLLHTEVADTDSLSFPSFVKFLHLRPGLAECRTIDGDVVTLVRFTIRTGIAWVVFVVDVNESLWPM